MDETTLNQLIVSFAELSIGEKRRELGREIAELTIVIKKLIADQIGAPLNDNLLNDFNNLYDSNTSEDEYLTGLFEDIIDFKEALGLLLSKNVFKDE